MVKKPDDAPEISIPTAAPTPPSKPEVYFIRYKAQRESTAAGGLAVGGATAHGGAIGGGAIGGGAIGGGAIGGGGITGGGISGSVSSGSSSTSVLGGGGRPSTNYGPPGQSGPY